MSTAEAETTAETEAKPEFVPSGAVVIKVGWPRIYPSNQKEPFAFYMRVQLVGDAEKIQREFLMRPDVDQGGDNLHQYDVEMISALSVKEPTGFPDWEAETSGFTETSIDVEKSLATLKEKIHSYFLPEDQERRAGMAFIVRGAMGRYWRVLEPVDYL